MTSKVKNKLKKSVCSESSEQNINKRNCSEKNNENLRKN